MSGSVTLPTTGCAVDGWRGAQAGLIQSVLWRLDVPAATIALRLRIPFAGTAITPVAPLTFTSGKRYFAYFLGTCSGGTFDFIIHVTP